MANARRLVRTPPLPQPAAKRSRRRKCTPHTPKQHRCTAAEWEGARCPVDAARAALLENYSIQSATRVSTTSYGGADRERRTDRITSVEVANDRMSVVLKVEALRVGFVYDIRLRNLTADGGVFFPAEAYYTLRTIPAE